MTQKQMQSTHKPLRVVIVGHVDHGKSTLIGRLLHDTNALPEGKLQELKDICGQRGTDALEWSFVLDSFQAERDQAITIDTTQIWFSTAQRDYVIIDAPGHREFLKNMISGAAAADAAILVVDAREGVQEQTRRHAYLLSLLGLQQISVVINKMDMVDHAQTTFSAIKAQVEDYLASINLQASHIVPISARNGDNIAGNSTLMPWYKGKTLTQTLDSFSHNNTPVNRPLRFPVQDVYRDGEDRIIVGRVESGTLRAGDRIMFSPTGEEATVTSLEVWPADPSKIKAQAGEVIGIKLDQRLFVERGHIASAPHAAPMLSNVLRANIFWLHDTPLKVGNCYTIRYATCQAIVTVQSIDTVIDTESLHHDQDLRSVTRNNVAEVTLRARDVLPLDPFSDNESIGRLVIYDGYDIAGGGCINMRGYPDQRQAAQPKSKNITKVDHLLTHDLRAKNMRQKGGVFWFTGLSGAGKSVTAMAAEKALYDRGYKTYVLDGDNIRYGLNKDLGFSPEDRKENIRRIGEVAALMADAGLIVITAFISPYRADREIARAAAPNHFHEVHVKADLATCESRDPKGLYKQARAGKIKQFTGIDSPYEAPEDPDLVLNTQDHDIATCVRQAVSYIQLHTIHDINDTGTAVPPQQQKAHAIAS